MAEAVGEGAPACAAAPGLLPSTPDILTLLPYTSLTPVVLKTNGILALFTAWEAVQGQADTSMVGNGWESMLLCEPME